MRVESSLQPSSPAHSPGTTAALSYSLLTSAFVGLWAQFWPEAFYHQFPSLGRAWVSVDGPFNEHLIRDVGGLNLALATLAFVSLLRPARVSPFVVGLVTLVFGWPHFVYHVAHLGQYALIDQIGNAVTLGLGLLVSLSLLMTGLRRRVRA